MTTRYPADSIIFHYGWEPAKQPEKMSEKELLARVKQLEKSLVDAQQDPAGFAAIIDEISGGTLALHLGGQIVQARKPSHIDARVGRVAILNKQGQVVGICESPPTFGVKARVARVLEGKKRRCEVAVGHGGETRVVMYPDEAPREGDEVLVDISMSVVVENLGPKPNELALSAETGVDWDDVGGLEDAKRELREAIEEPVLHRELYAAYGKRPTKGVLLWGRPGNGKTLLAKAAATALARLHGQSLHKGGYIYVKGPELLNKFVGASEAGVREIFAAARRHAAAHGYPPLVFIDEADAILGKRGRQGIEGMERTIVPQFLAEMDGLDEMTALVVLATNRADALDPAVVRDGRVDRKVEVGPPGRADAARIVARVLSKRKVAAGESAGELGAAAARLMFEEKRALYMVRVKDGKDRRVGLADFVSGALCAGVAERATQRALRRHLAKDGSEGVKLSDVEGAVADAFESLRGTDHTGDLQAVLDGLPAADIISVEKAR